MSTVFYFSGRCGDSLHQWPVAYWWHRRTREPFECWLDEPTCKNLAPLFRHQPGVSEVNLVVPDAPKANRVLIHGMGIYRYTNQKPGVWEFLARIRGELEACFTEIVFIGSPEDRDPGMIAYPGWAEWADHGDFLKLATYMNTSRLVIGCGSSMVALAHQLMVPSVRVHDPLADFAAEIWSGLGSNQLNATEPGLRTQWPEFRDKWLPHEWLA